MATDAEQVQIRRDGPSGTIIIDRPQRRNALARETVQQLTQAFDDFHSQGSVRAIILTGANDTFCAGTDLHQLKETAESKTAFETWHRDAQALLGLIETMLRFPKPIVVSVNGWTAGTGLALMLAADIVVGTTESKLLMPEALRGLSAGLTTPLLSFRTGTGTASRILYSGKPIDAQTALGLGLLHEIVEPDLAWARAFDLAQQCAAGARESHQMTKQLINETIGESLFMQLNVAAANMAAARTTPAAIEGVNAFLEKRQPQWD